jgi:nucleoside-diphosphate-sugar epimerase
MKVLIIGGHGFIGNAIHDTLKADGHEVVSTSSRVSTNYKNLLIDSNLFDTNSMEALLNFVEPDVVIQSSWVTEKKNYEYSADNLRYSSATVDLARLCFQKNIRHFVGIGSSAEYGVYQPNCIAGKSPTLPETAYAQSKLRTFELISEISDSFSTRFTWVRIFQPYGKGLGHSRLIPIIVNGLQSGSTVRIQRPNNVLDWISVEDIASAISFLLKVDTPKVLDVGTGVGTSVLDLANSIAEILNLDSGLISTSANPLADEINYLVVGKESPLFQAGWNPEDALLPGLRRMFSK